MKTIKLSRLIVIKTVRTASRCITREWAIKNGSSAISSDPIRAVFLSNISTSGSFVEGLQ